MKTSEQLLTTDENNDVVQTLETMVTPIPEVHFKYDREKMKRLMNKSFLVTHPNTGIITTGEFLGDRSSPYNAREVLTKVRTLLGTEEILSIPLHKISELAQVQQQKAQ